ncbi:MAG: class I SAM-dependent methyltransferase [Candidatus Protistobacter heckmanni]|nr:class I SAM-dependent methyltransferase [Candidatus Protistobacter heckmanni]
MTATRTRHLDLNCGLRPRNPYGRDQVYGIDIRRPPNLGEEFFRAANLSVQGIPFEDNFFDSVSAYDFLEHVPRVLLSGEGTGTVFPFVRLMDEIWRVLKPDGKLYAVTPYYPRSEIFTDPTHVNPVTLHTHTYFVEPHLDASAYGFKGRFAGLRVKYEYEPHSLTASQALRKALDFIKRRNSHIPWELAARK